MVSTLRRTSRVERQQKLRSETLSLPWWTIMQNDDGTFYINEYRRNANGITNRTTIADGMSQNTAKKTLNNIKHHFAAM